MSIGTWGGAARQAGRHAAGKRACDPTSTCAGVRLLLTQFMSADRPPLRAYVLAFTTIYLVWGSTYLAIRVAVESIPPFAMASARFALAGALMLGFLRLRGASWPTPRQWRDAMITGAFLLVGGNGTVTWAEQTIPSSITALLIGSALLTGAEAVKRHQASSESASIPQLQLRTSPHPTRQR